MPYKRNNRRRRRRRPGRMAIYKGAGQQLWRDVKSIKRLMNVEFKFIDSQNTSQAVATTPLIFELSNIAQGDTTITRDGSQIKCLSIQLSYVLSLHASATFSFVRVLLIKDKQTNQVVYTGADVLDDVTVADSIVSPYNRDNRKRFTILHDRVHQLNSTEKHTAYFGKKFSQDQIIRYDANAGTIADLTQSSYSLMVVTNEVTNTPLITSFVRLNFVDN